MKWKYCQTDGPPKEEQPVWILRLNAPRATFGFFYPISNRELGGFRDADLRAIWDPYAWMPRKDGDQQPASPFIPGVLLPRCPAGTEHIFQFFPERFDPDGNPLPADHCCYWCGQPTPEDQR